jgi:hypothetical protein
MIGIGIPISHKSKPRKPPKSLRLKTFDRKVSSHADIRNGSEARDFPSKLDLGFELNNLLGWNFEVIRGTDSIARHEGEQRLAPQREGRMDAWDRKKETSRQRRAGLFIHLAG